MEEVKTMKKQLDEFNEKYASLKSEHENLKELFEKNLKSSKEELE